MIPCVALRKCTAWQFTGEIIVLLPVKTKRKGSGVKKIIVRMRGGLGNQLFILASAYSVARQFEDYELVIDDREYKKYKIRSLWR